MIDVAQNPEVADGSLGGPRTAAAIATLAAHEPAALHTQLPVLWTGARGGRIHGEGDRVWLDWTSGILATNLGHAPQRVVDAMREQLRAPLVHTYAFATEVRADTVRLLCGLTGYQYTLLTTTGTEAVEAALKLCRSQARARGRQRAAVVSFEGAFHGRTAGAQLAGGLAYQRHWTPAADGEFVRLDYPDGSVDPVAELERAPVTPDEVACVLVEPYQGSTLRAVDPRAAMALAQWCRAHDVPLIFDEIQSGFGRTGVLFAHERLGVRPDLLLCGKGLASGMPVSAVLYDDPDLTRAIRPGELTTTHAGNPVALAAARATLELFALPETLAGAEVVESALRGLLDALHARWPDRLGFRTVLGSVAGVAITDRSGKPDPAAARRLVRECAHRGLMLLAPVGPGGNLVKFAPAPVMPAEDMAEGRTAVLAAAERAWTDGSGG